MFTRDERRALVFLAAVSLAGGIVRLVRAGAGPPGAALVAPELAGGDVAAQAARARHALELARPLGPGETVDVDRAEAAEIERLPRVGPELARRIVEDREAHGPFGSLAGLARVAGIGPGTLKGLERRAVFSGQPRPALPSPEPPGGARPGPAPGSPRPPPACPAEPLSLNRASAAELACLPGIGPALAGRIVSYRTAHGPFSEVKMLEQVPGIGPGRLARLAPHLRLP